MLKRKTEAEIPIRDKIIIGSSVRVKNPEEITHVSYTSSSKAHYLNGVFAYNTTKEIASSLDDEFLGWLNFKSLISDENQGLCIFLKHLPTWEKMIESGEVKDLRTKKEKEEIPPDNKIKNPIVKISPMRRTLI